MDSLFTKQTGSLFALTGFLLWVSLSNGLLPATQSCPSNAEGICSSQLSIAHWVKALSDHNSVHGQPVQREGIISSSDSNRKPDGLLAETRLSQRLAPDQGALAFHQLYQTHCYQRTGADDSSPLTEL